MPPASTQARLTAEEAVGPALGLWGTWRRGMMGEHPRLKGPRGPTQRGYRT